MPRTAARCVLICWILLIGCAVAACGNGPVRESVSSFASSKGVTASPSVSTTPSFTRTPSASASSAPATSTAASAPGTTAPATHPPAAAAPAAPAATVTTTAGEPGSSLLWLWIVLAAAAVIGLITVIAAARRRGKSAAADWRTRLVDAYARGAALHDAMVAAETPGALESADATARWSDIQRRADDFSQVLYTLRETAADDGDRVRIADVLASLHAARSAMAAERSAGNAGGTMSNVVRDRLAFFMASLRNLREHRVRPA